MGWCTDNGCSPRGHRSCPGALESWGYRIEMKTSLMTYNYVNTVYTVIRAPVTEMLAEVLLQWFFTINFCQEYFMKTGSCVELWSQLFCQWCQLGCHISRSSILSSFWRLSRSQLANVVMDVVSAMANTPTQISKRIVSISIAHICWYFTDILQVTEY